MNTIHIYRLNLISHTHTHTHIHNGRKSKIRYCFFFGQHNIPLRFCQQHFSTNRSISQSFSQAVRDSIGWSIDLSCRRWTDRVKKTIFFSSNTITSHLKMVKDLHQQVDGRETTKKKWKLIINSIKQQQQQQWKWNKIRFAIWKTLLFMIFLSFTFDYWQKSQWKINENKINRHSYINHRLWLTDI